jgi:3-(3-hydroxy-phenyl)propionate hydroxylase
MKEFDVVVVGYGPTGQMLAATLGLAGHRVAVVERWPTLYGLPRLSHIDDEAARIVQAVADVDAALVDSDGIDTYTFISGSGEILTRLASGRDKNEPWVCGYPRDISIFQPDIEAAVDATVQSCDKVTQYLGFEAIGLAFDADGAVLTIAPKSNAEGGEPLRLRGRFLVGCDGSRSFVREAAGITRTDHGFNERWLDIDVIRRRPLDPIFDETVQYCDPARGHMHMPIGKKRLRFEMALLPGEDSARFTEPDFAWKFMGERHGLGPDDVEIIRHLVYTFEARVADQWRRGPLILAGDAAHTMPPYLGQGACSGMRDGFNLGWKLDLILCGLAHPSILDTYEAERRPHVTFIMQSAIALGKIANEHDPERARLRDEMLRNEKPAPFVMPGLEDGLIARGEALAGTIWPQGKVCLRGKAGRFDDVVGNGFVLMSRHSIADALGEERLLALRQIGCRLVSLDDPAFEDSDGIYGDYFTRNDISVLLARPDFALFGAVTTDEDAPKLIDRLLAHLREGVDCESHSIR